MNLKKILPSIFAIGALTAMMSVSAMAAPEITISAPSEVSAGSSIDITISAKEMPEMAWLVGKMYFSGDVFTSAKATSTLSVYSCSECGDKVAANHISDDLFECGGTLTETALMGEVAPDAPEWIEINWGTSAMDKVFTAGLTDGATTQEEDEGMLTETDGQVIGKITFDIPMNATPGRYEFSISGPTGRSYLSDGDTRYNSEISGNTIYVTVVEATAAVGEAAAGNKIDADNNVTATGEYYTFYADALIDMNTYPTAHFYLKKTGAGAGTKYMPLPAFTGKVEFQAIVKTNKTGNYTYAFADANEGNLISDTKTYRVSAN